MAFARDIMHLGADCVSENETLGAAARKMRDLHVGSLPICGNDDRLHGIITDRDIVVSCVAEGSDPQTTSVREFAHGTPIWVDANDDQNEVLNVMTENRIRRVPVMENSRLVGMISEGDLATHLDEHEVGQFAFAVYSAPPSS